MAEWLGNLTSNLKVASSNLVWTLRKGQGKKRNFSSKKSVYVCRQFEIKNMSGVQIHSCKEVEWEQGRCPVGHRLEFSNILRGIFWALDDQLRTLKVNFRACGRIWGKESELLKVGTKVGSRNLRPGGHLKRCELCRDEPFSPVYR